MSSLDDVYAAAAGHSSGLAVTAHRFQTAWRRLCDSGDSPSPDHAADLYLALACLDGESAALTRLEHRLTAQLTQLNRFRLSDDEARTLVAETLSSLCTGAHPRLTRYSARGPLDAWLGVLLTRQALSLRTAKAPEDLDEVLLGSQATDGVPEVELLKQRFRGVFSDAFKAAIGALDVKQRNLLRQHYLDGLTLEELALLYRVHRATVARNLAEARTTLLERTRDEVAQRTAIGRLEVDSIVRLVQSHLDVSAAFFLNRTGARE